jgi:hypothetical protein
LHDTGRFEQYARYKTFVDSQSVDHAVLGVGILEKNEILCSLDEPTQDFILRTIRYHNRAILPREETETCLFFTKLLRDADKLDILKVVTDYYSQQNGNRNGALRSTTSPCIIRWEEPHSMSCSVMSPSASIKRCSMLGNSGEIRTG